MNVPSQLHNGIIVLYLLMVIILSTYTFDASIRLNKIKLLGIRFDYILHVLMFIPWMILVRLRWGDRDRRAARFWQGLIFGFLLILLSEGVQRFFPSRSPSYYDLVANVVGLGLGTLLSERSRSHRKA